MEISFSNRLRAADQVLFRELDGESVLLNVATESYFGLDDVGTRMWMLLTTNETIQHSYERLAEEYEVSESQLRKDIQALIEELIEHGLVKIETP